ncbi:SGNH/GDSL hydrolase family protein [Rathayibacter soli]|uniref:SGNH/GDSL hydrolase family protein n=1 Tax=Rathayibacter soli TaxID=3144168 RepID=UPI0027E41289|nr:GDSL-type esterase/lipase family protein [Glaciibacter superstes]
MRIRSLFATGLAVVVVGVLVGIGAALLSTAGADRHPNAPSPDAASTAQPSASASKTAQPNATSSAKPATPTPTPEFADYVAIGDSYAAGMGGGNETGRCRRSPQSYPKVLAQTEDIRLTRTAACSGATTADVQRDQLDALSTEDDLVTLTIGGNDLDVAGLANTCAKGVTRSCQADFQESLTLLNVLPDRLAATYAKVVQAAPHARIVITGYPLLFVIPPTDNPEFSTFAVVNAATASMNQQIRDAVGKLKKNGANVAYAPISFAGHEFGTKEPWITTSGPDIFHPNAAGYRAMAKAIERVLD